MAKRRRPPTMDAKFRIALDESSRRMCGKSAPARPHRDVGSKYLEAVANRLLAKAGFFQEAEQPLGEYKGQAYYRADTEADSIGQGGHLRPTWTGRA